MNRSNNNPCFNLWTGILVIGDRGYDPTCNLSIEPCVDGIKKEYLGGFTIIAISLTRIYTLMELRCPARGILNCTPIDAIVLAGKTPLSWSFPICRRLWCLLRRLFHTEMHSQCNDRAQNCDSNDKQD